MTPPDKSNDPQATPQPDHGGPSWSLMLFLIFLAMLVAAGIAWSFTHRFFQHH